MQVPFLDLKSQYNSIKSEVNSAIQNVLDKTEFILGPAVNNFEKEFSKAHNLNNTVAVSSGTAGNHLVLWALGIKPGDEVIIPANTFIATAWGATLCGATPVFVDVEEDSCNLDPSKVEDAITSRTKAIIAVHLYGQPADMDKLKVIANKHNLLLVEDAAQAHLAEYKGARVGSLASAASFSFYPGKNLGAYGEGGAVTTNNDELTSKIKMIRDHGAVQKYNHEIFGHNYRMDGIQGAVLGVKLNYISDWTEARRKVAEKYRKYLNGVDGIVLPTEKEYAKHVYHLFVVQVSENDSAVRDQLSEYLKGKGISTGFHYPVPLHLQKCFAHLNYKKGDFPIAEKLADTGLSLPMYPELTDEQIKYVCENIKSFFQEDSVSNKQLVSSK